MRMVGDVEHTTFITGVVDVFRRCKQCDQYKRIGNYNHSGTYVSHVCNRCQHDNALVGDTSGMYVPSRGITITEQGYADLRRWEREERKHGA